MIDSNEKIVEALDFEKSRQTIMAQDIRREINPKSKDVIGFMRSINDSGRIEDMILTITKKVVKLGRFKLVGFYFQPKELIAEFTGEIWTDEHNSWDDNARFALSITEDGDLDFELYQNRE